jgi:hypothetical protein
VGTFLEVFPHLVAAVIMLEAKDGDSEADQKLGTHWASLVPGSTDLPLHERMLESTAQPRITKMCFFAVDPSLLWCFQSAIHERVARAH